MRFKYMVIKRSYTYHSETQSAVHECNSAEEAFSWIDNNTPGSDEWVSYMVTVVRTQKC